MRLFLFLVSLAFVWCITAGEIDFTDADIVTGESTASESAARLLKTYMNKLSGGKTEIVPDAALCRDRRILLRIAGPDENMGKQTWRILHKGNEVRITGGSPSALVYGVSDFLARAGIYALTWDCDALPPSGRLLVQEDLDASCKRAFPRTRIVTGMESLFFRYADASQLRKEWIRFLDMNCARLQYADDDTPYRSYQNRNEVHNLYTYMPPEKYAKDHPEYYTQNAHGKRVWGPTDHLCFSNPEVRRVMAENVIETIRAHRTKKKTDHPVFYNISQNDCGGQFCFCPACVAMAEKYGGETGLLLDFINEVADRVTAVYPDVKLGTEAYVNSEKPLQTVKPNSHVLIRYCDLYSRSNPQVPLEEQPDRLKNIEEWAAQVPGLRVWDYLNFVSTSGGDSLPEMTLDANIRDIRLFRQLGVGDLLLEFEIGPLRPQSFIYLQYFVAYQLMKDPDQDAEELIALFIRNYYGAAAAEMREYFDLLREKIRSNGKKLSDRGKYADAAFLERSRSILAEALKKAGGDAVLKVRILQELNNVDYRYIALLKLRNEEPERIQEVFGQYRENLLFSLENSKLLSEQAREAIREKYLQTELALMTIDFPLPDELKGKKLAACHKIALSLLRKTRTSVGLQADPCSDMGKAVFLTEEDEVAHGLPFAIGFYDWGTKKSGSFSLEKVIADDQYHWYKLGKIRVGPRTVLWVHGSWKMMAELSSFYISDDGLAESGNPNFYEAWISLRFRGPAYSGEKAASGERLEETSWLDDLWIFLGLKEPAESREAPEETGNGVWFDKLLLVSPED